MFPIGTVGRRDFRAYATFFLIVANVLVFLLEAVVFVSGEAAVNHFFNTYAFSVCNLGQVSPLISMRNGFFSLFLHSGLPHLFFNMSYLWVFGPRVEEYLGHRRFLVFYLMVGMLGTFAHAIFGSTICDPNIPYGTGLVVGASGAIAGVMGAFLFLFPMAKVRTAIVIKVFNIYAFVYLIIWVMMDVIKAFGTEQTGIAHWGHIGGFAAGFGVLFLATMFKPAPKVDAFEELDD